MTASGQTVDLTPSQPVTGCVRRSRRNTRSVYGVWAVSLLRKRWRWPDPDPAG